MSWNYKIEGWPKTSVEIEILIDSLLDLYPNITQRQFTRRLETRQEAVISAGFHEQLIDPIEMETCYEYLETGKVLTAK